MKLFKCQVLIACLALAVGVFGVPLERIAIDGLFHNQIEDFRRQLPCGLDGGPPLAPFTIDHVSLEMNDPMMVSTGYATNVTISGLDGFVINNLDFTLFRMRIEYSITLPVLELTGNYILNATALELLEIWGEGPFRMVIHNSNVRGYMRLNIVRGYLNVEELEATLSLERLESQIEGIFDDEESTEYFNDLFEQLAGWLLEENQAAISGALQDTLKPMLNSVVNQLTLSDLLGRHANARIAKNSEPLQCEF